MIYFSILDKSYLTIFKQKMQQILQPKTVKTTVQASNSFYCLNYCFQFIDKNIKIATENERLTEKELAEFVEEL